MLAVGAIGDADAADVAVGERPAGPHIGAQPLDRSSRYRARSRRRGADRATRSVGSKSTRRRALRRCLATAACDLLAVPNFVVENFRHGRFDGLPDMVDGTSLKVIVHELLRWFGGPDLKSPQPLITNSGLSF